MGAKVDFDVCERHGNCLFGAAKVEFVAEIVCLEGGGVQREPREAVFLGGAKVELVVSESHEAVCFRVQKWTLLSTRVTENVSLRVQNWNMLSATATEAVCSGAKVGFAVNESYRNHLFRGAKVGSVSRVTETICLGCNNGVFERVKMDFVLHDGKHLRRNSVQF